MLSRLASYLMLGAASGVEEEEVAAPTTTLTTAPSTTPTAADGLSANPVDARFRQVEIEGDDWILIDRNVEAMAGLDESWYVTPPACFTQPGPVHVETSPLEDLLIEHPSMSVYRAAGPAPLSDKPKSKERPGKRRSTVAQVANKTLSPVAPPASVSQTTVRLPLAPRINNFQSAALISATGAMPKTQVSAPVLASKLPRPQEQPPQQLELASKFKDINPSSNNNRSKHRRHQHHQHNPYQSATGTVVEQTPRRPTMRDLRNARGDENVRIVQIRSSQKMLEKRSTQSTKRNHLERGNKAREVSSGKGRRPRRQDRLRLNNSGANNNRKC